MPLCEHTLVTRALTLPPQCGFVQKCKKATPTTGFSQLREWLIETLCMFYQWLIEELDAGKLLQARLLTWVTSWRAMGQRIQQDG